MSQVSKAVELATTIKLSGGNRVVVSDVLACCVGVSQGAKGAKYTGLVSCGLREC